jgi:hypothetical protein
MKGENRKTVSGKRIPSVVIVLTAFIGILTVVVFWGVEMARGMSQSPGRRADEDAGG